MGSKGSHRRTRRRGLLRRAHLALAALIGIAAAPASAQTDGEWAAAVQELEGRLFDPELRAEATAELVAIWQLVVDELEAAPVPELDAAHACIQIATLLVHVPDEEHVEAGASRAMLGRARTIAIRIQDGDRLAWVEYRLAGLELESGELGAVESRLEPYLDPAASQLVSVPYLRLLLAQVYRQQGRWTEGLEILGALREDLAQRAASPTTANQRARLDLLEARYWRSLGRPVEAARLVAQAEEHARDAGDPLTLAEQRLAAADEALLVEEYEYALDILGEEAFPEGLLTAELALYRGFALSRLARDSGSPEGLRGRAREALQLAIAAPGLGELDRLRAELWLAELEDEAGELEAVGEWLGAARARLDGRGEAAPPELEAQLVAKEARLLRRRGAGREQLGEELARLEGCFDELLASWARVPAVRGGTGFLHLGSRRQVISELIELALHGDRESGAARALSYVLRAQSLGSMARRAKLGEVRLADVRRELLGEGGGILVLLPALDGSHLFAIDSERVEHFALPPVDPLRRASLALRAELQAIPRTFRESRARRERQLASASRRLAELLLPPEARAAIAGWHEVTVVGSEFLYGVPFECLAFEDGRLFGQVHAVDSLPSLPLGVLLARRYDEARGERPCDLFLLAHLEPSSSVRARWPDVPSISIASRALARLTRPYEAQRRRAPSLPGPAALASADAAGAAVVQLLVHGVPDGGDGWATRLVLRTGRDADELVGWKEIADLQFSGAVFLTACGAGAGPSRMGDDVLAHLGGGFLEAGATCVVLSRSPVEYDASLDLLELAHERLRGHGASPAEALRHARAALAARRGTLGSFADAEVQVVGLGQRPCFP